MVLPDVHEGDDDVSDGEAQEGEVHPDAPPSINPTRAALPVIVPEVTSGYDTAGGAAASPTTARTAAPSPALGFGVGTTAFNFPASPSSNEEERSKVRQETVASPVIQASAPSPVSQPSAPSPVSRPLALVNASDKDAINTEDLAGEN